MESRRLIEVVRIIGVYGVRGALRATLLSSNLKSYKKIYNADGQEFDFSIVRYCDGNKVILSVSGLDDRTTAESLKGTCFYVKKTDLPEAEEDEFYVCDLVGQFVTLVDVADDNIDVDGKIDVFAESVKFVELATDQVNSLVISNVYNFGAGDIIEIKHNDDAFLVPFTRENFPVTKKDDIQLTKRAFILYSS
jgi:16S rRNA processing protein RimM